MINKDLIWLRSEMPQLRDLTQLNGQASQIVKVVEDAVSLSALPHTAGYFGTWGSGKTTTLAVTEDRLSQNGYEVLYFNAYKYAGFMEVIPALIFMILSSIEIKPTLKNQLLSLAASLTRKYGDSFGEWVEQRVGVNPVEIGKDIGGIINALDSPNERHSEIIKRFYTRVDETQDLLLQMLGDRDKPLVVLIDELDRCDPGEAFTVLKELRVLFSMRGLPIVFVIAANPEPIGLAIKHQFGLSDSVSEYESARILEKFVDSYIDITPTSLAGFLTHIWQKHEEDLSRAGLIHELDARSHREKQHSFNHDTIRNATALEAVWSGNPAFTNLRLLDKSLLQVKANGNSGYHPWAYWMLQVLKQSNPALRRKIASATDDLKEITEQATISMLRELHHQRQVQDGVIDELIDLNHHSHRTPWSIYYSAYWEAFKRHKAELIGKGRFQRADRLECFMSDMNAMACLSMLGIINLNNHGNVPSLSSNPSGWKYFEQTVSDFNPILMNNYGWLLSYG